MEVKCPAHRKLQPLLLLMAMLCASVTVVAQPGYRIREGQMQLELPQKMASMDLDHFVQQFNLGGIGLHQWHQTKKFDSLQAMGWIVKENNSRAVVLRKSLEALDIPMMGADIFFPVLPVSGSETNSREIKFGVNRFKNETVNRQPGANTVFFLKGHTKARQVLLAGTFTRWQDAPLRMAFADSGWKVDIKLPEGPHYYKFIVDGNWIIDPDNLIKQNDGEGNINSVYYRPNALITLKGFTNARKVFVAGSFNNWRKEELALKQEKDQWALPVYLAPGTHTYKYYVDGKGIPDPINPDMLPDENGGYNSVLHFGKPHLFRLHGNTNASKVLLAGSFNGWRRNELFMKRTATGWELPYVLAPGNYEYKFLVDGHWITDPANDKKVRANKGETNSFLVVEPNHSFQLSGYGGARQVAVTGDFNGWDEKGMAMKRAGDAWVFDVHLRPGKHRYKFIVDGEWIIDPSNKLWEQNEFGTGNSVLWIR